MSGERVYPDEPSGPFPEPPLTAEDREGRTIEVRGYEPGAAVPEAVVAMYEAFDPADRAQGIPPSGEEAVRRWLATIFGEGLNAVAWEGETVAGHATLVPEGGGKAAGPDTAGAAPAAGTDGTADAGPYELAIFVLQSYQGAGIGTHLLEGLLGYGAARGADRVWLTVEQWNRAAIGLYEKVGFEVADGGSGFELEMSIALDGD